MFNGKDPMGWIFRVEQYQRATGITEVQLMIVVAARLTSDTIPWYQWLERTIGNLTWVQITRALSTRFGKLEEADPGGALSKLRQNGTVKEYQVQFERLANRTNGLPESFLVSCFLSGLREEFKVGVQILKPVTLTHAFELAKFQEEAINANKRAVQGSRVEHQNATATMGSSTALRELQRELENKANDLSKLQKDIAKNHQVRKKYTIQLGENELVLKELGLLNEGANVYKLIGPVLVKQDLAEANANVRKRIEYISAELKRLDATVQDLEEKQNSKKEAIFKVQQRIQSLQAGKAKA
ncbi:hypothetical protein LWI29_020745 [Acer saccharum]|uniref:Retrotransposon gag domain-containing protein n=1 Tax=Acer saccharum TaxID=4024 RepID=A0AA39VGF9_ACESA|nr:hypothetical protein LWI29_020745 [Acer saccharum]